MTRHKWTYPLLGLSVLGIAVLSQAGEPAATVRYRVSEREAPRHVIAQGKGSATLLHHAATGATAASMTLLVLDKGALVPEHVHEASAELLYIEEGAVEMTVNGQKLRAQRGDALYIPAGVKHSAQVVSEGPMRGVQVYAGPGPEQRFTQGPRVDKPADTKQEAK